MINSIFLFRLHVIEQFENLNSIIFFQRARQLKTKRDEATDSYKAGRFQEAFDLYSTALSIDPSNKTILAKLYCSRATVLAKVSSTDLGRLIYDFRFVQV